MFQTEAVLIFGFGFFWGFFIFKKLAINAISWCLLFMFLWKRGAGGKQIDDCPN